MDSIVLKKMVWNIIDKRQHRFLSLGLFKYILVIKLLEKEYKFKLLK